MMNTLPKRTYRPVSNLAWLDRLELDDELPSVEIDVSDLRGNAAEEWAAQLDAAGVPNDRAGVAILNERRRRTYERHAVTLERYPVTRPEPTCIHGPGEGVDDQRSDSGEFARWFAISFACVVVLIAVCVHFAH